jgi:hypothetical protein
MSLPEHVPVALGILAFAYLAVAGVLYALMLKQSRPETVLKSADPNDSPGFAAAAAKRNTWLSEHGFEWDGGYSFMGILIAAWTHESEPTYFCLYLKGGSQSFTDFVTVLNGGRGALTTGSTRDGLLMPKGPGDYHQAFPGKTLDESWQLHRQALDYLCGRPGTSIAGGPGGFSEALIEGVAGQARFVRSLPLWPLRWPYWFFIRRFRMNNKTVREQIESGLVSDEASLG